MATPTKKTMFNYFTKLPSKPTNTVEENPRKSAPVFNKVHVEEFQKNRLDQFDTELLRNSDIGATKNYITSLGSNEHKPFRVYKKPRGSLRVRLLQFSEDVRPPYFGTWQKESKLVSGRRPLGQDKEIFEYDVDSEAEWDIGGPGESLKGDDSEDEEENDDYEIDMQTFVPHGYVSDDEVDPSDNEENQSADNTNRSQTEDDNCDCAVDDEDSDIKIISDAKVRRIATQQPQPPKQTPKMDVKPIVLGVSFEDNPLISETKIQFLRTFQGVSCDL